MQLNTPLAGDLQFDLINLSRKFIRSKIKGAKPRRVNVQEMGWYELVCAFSQRNLTFATDALPALSGIARAVHEVTGARYLAGLWTSSARERLLWSLLWTPNDRDDTTVRRAHNGSPSWSWASLVADIRPDYSEGRLIRDWGTHCEVFLAEATAATANPYGQVNGGVIGLHGHLHVLDRGPSTFADLRIGRIRASERHDDDNAERASPTASLNRQVALNEDSWRFWAVDEPLPPPAGPASELRPFELNHSLDLPDEPHDWTSGKFWLLLLGTWSTKGSADDEDDMWQHFMILKEAADRPAHHYERVGLAEAFSKEDRLLIIEEQGWNRQTVYIV